MNEKKPFQQAAFIVMILALILYLPAEVLPGTTGKIAGRLVDAQTGDPLPGANVVVQGLSSVPSIAAVNATSITVGK